MENINDKLKIIYGDINLGVRGKDFHYIFSYQRGGLESLKIKNKEWLYRVPRPTFWRATTDNDRGNNFSFKSSMWLGADMFMKCINVTVKVDDIQIEKPTAPENNRYSPNEFCDSLEIMFTLQTSTSPSTTVDVTYRVEKGGKIKVKMFYHGKKGLPELPLLGMRFIMPTKATGYIYEGLSGFTYPDRKAGGEKGTFEVDGLPITPYLVPQDCGVHMDTKWVEIKRESVLNNSDLSNEQFSLRFSSIEKDFAFSCIPYTAEELENATHIEELPLERRTVLLILLKVRGVGGINSWGSDVSEEFKISAQEDRELYFEIN